ncbi:hypothetical protein [Solimonas flava]|uniref:hypothetical protein n=1 Tax=Solimonas flava TaxID=415849 RepID=UPI0004843F78|nr:hypothetical protein [Solimonas flava]
MAKDLYALVELPASAVPASSRAVDAPADAAIAAAPGAAAATPVRATSAGWQRFNRWIVRAYGALAPSARYK